MRKCSLQTKLLNQKSNKLNIHTAGDSDTDDSSDSGDEDSDESEDKVPSSSTTPSGAATLPRTSRRKTEEADMVRKKKHNGKKDRVSYPVALVP